MSLTFTYTKLMSTITNSSIWSECHATKVVWVTMLAMSDKNGNVFSSIPGLSRMSNATMDETLIALDCFLSPDPFSRTEDFEGRRIEKIDGGWRLLNHAKYREARDADIRREQVREAVARHRSKVPPPNRK